MSNNTAIGRIPVDYVLPLRWPAGRDFSELARYLQWLAHHADVMVVDGSPAEVRQAHRAWLASPVRVIEPDMSLGLNGKAAAVLSAVPFLRNDSVVIADDDVRYSLDCLEQVAQRLRTADIVRPQNYFAPLVWHARWDTARSLLNRSLASDYPGTLGIRRARLEQGYGGDVLFENLELIRTVLARGGEEERADDIFVERRPPTARAFWAQRVRQAYDSFAQPGRLVAELAIVPAVLLLCRRPAALGVAGAAAIAVAERGRRRSGGGGVFAPTAALWAPIWLAERGLCSWAAIVMRLRGGPVYHGQRLKKAASTRRMLDAAITKEEQIERTVSDNNAVPERAAAGARRLLNRKPRFREQRAANRGVVPLRGLSD